MSAYNPNQWYIPLNNPKPSKRSTRRRPTNRRLEATPSRKNVVPDFDGSAVGAIDRGENTLYQVPVDPSGALSFGNWPYPGKGLYGLGYNFKPMAAVVMPVLLIAAMALLYPGLINAARFGRKKRSVRDDVPDEAEGELNSLHRTVVAATEACVKRFACESQNAAKENEFVRGFLSVFGEQNQENTTQEARTMEEESSCAEYGCGFISSFFGK